MACVNNNDFSLKTKVNTPVEKVKYNGKQYYLYNVSAGQDNWSQRNSKYTYTYKNFTAKWTDFCNVTTMAMGLIYTGIYSKWENEIDSKYPELKRLPDKLAKYLIESDEIREYYKKRFPGTSKDFFNGVKGAYSPNEIHNVLSYGTNLFVDVGTITYFSTNVYWKDIIREILYYKNPVGISGKFSGLHHIVTLTGCAYLELEDGDQPGENQAPDFLIVDDPYGETYNYSAGKSGNDIWIPFSRCVEDFKPLNSKTFKYAHRFIRPEFLGY